jgi:hypothetical protein
MTLKEEKLEHMLGKGLVIENIHTYDNPQSLGRMQRRGS